MRILLIGEYSRVHLTLAEGLRSLGHEVVVASNGDGYKSYPRDIDLLRRDSSILETLKCIFDFNKKIKSFKNFDVVQLINPCFTDLNIKFNKRYFKQLKTNNDKIFLGAFGDDSYWVRACRDKNLLPYSEFHIEGKETNIAYNQTLADRWLNTELDNFNTEIATQCNGIIACLYEYYKAYKTEFPNKLKYIPIPINTEKIIFEPITEIPEKINFLIGIHTARSDYKGTDILLEVLSEYAKKHPDQMHLETIESVSYDEYVRILKEAHIVVDQLYSHSPSVNPLQSMAYGKAVISGGERPMYELLDPKNLDLHPILNVYPTRKGIEELLDYILANKDKLPQWSQDGRAFVEKYHDAKKVAQQYIDFWTSH